MKKVLITVAVLVLFVGTVYSDDGLKLIRYKPGISNYAIGMVYAEVFEDYSRAANWWRKGAERGDQFSQTALGGYYALLGDSLGDRSYFLNADGTEDTDKIEQSYAEGMKWLRLTSEKGSEYAQDLINIIYYDEDSASSKDRLEAAIRWGEAVEVKY